MKKNLLLLIIVFLFGNTVRSQIPPPPPDYYIKTYDLSIQVENAEVIKSVIERIAEYYHWKVPYNNLEYYNDSVVGNIIIQEVYSPLDHYASDSLLMSLCAQLK